MTQAEITPFTINAIFDEIEQRIDKAIIDGTCDDNERAIKKYRQAVMQGCIAVLITISSNWCDVLTECALQEDKRSF